MNLLIINLEGCKYAIPCSNNEISLNPKKVTHFYVHCEVLTSVVSISSSQPFSLATVTYLKSQGFVLQETSLQKKKTSMQWLEMLPGAPLVEKVDWFWCHLLQQKTWRLFCFWCTDECIRTAYKLDPNTFGEDARKQYTKKYLRYNAQEEAVKDDEDPSQPDTLNKLLSSWALCNKSFQN